LLFPFYRDANWAKPVILANIIAKNGFQIKNNFQKSHEMFEKLRLQKLKTKITPKTVKFENAYSQGPNIGYNLY